MRKLFILIAITLVANLGFSQGGYTPFAKIRLTTPPVENNSATGLLVYDSVTGNVNQVKKDSLKQGIDGVLATGSTATNKQQTFITTTNPNIAAVFSHDGVVSVGTNSDETRLRSNGLFTQYGEFESVYAAGRLSNNSNGFVKLIDFGTPTQNSTIVFPDKPGTVAMLSDIVGGGGIPITGTEPDNPVTGDIEMYNPANDDTYKISASDDFSVYKTSDGKGFGMNSTGINFNFDEDSKGIQGSFLYDKQGDPNAFAQIGDLKNNEVKVSKGLISGDSTIAQYNFTNSVGSYIMTPADSLAGTTLTDIAFPGDLILTQKNKWLALSDKESYDWIIVQIGLNNVTVGSDPATVIAAYQDYVDTINADRKTGSKLIIGTMNPALGDSNINGTAWMALNEAIMGAGTTPITGVDVRINEHTNLLGDESNHLLSYYDVGDHLHENNLGREVIGLIYRKALRQLNFIPQSGVNSTENTTA